jgi:hypothetical protein
MTSLEQLARPIPFEEVVSEVPARFRIPLRRVFANGGLLAPKTLSAVVEVLRKMDPILGEKLGRLSASRRELIAALGDREKLGAALEIAGVGTDEMLQWTPATISIPSTTIATPCLQTVCPESANMRLSIGTPSMPRASTTSASE